MVNLTQMPKTMEELEMVKKKCKKYAEKNARLSALASAIPILGVDILLDVPLITKTILKIGEDFGLSPEQVAALDGDTRERILLIIGKMGPKLICQIINKEILKMVAAKLAGNIVAKKQFPKIIPKIVTKMLTKQAEKQVAKQILKQGGKFVPIIGQGIAAMIGYLTAKAMFRTYINECYTVCERMINPELVNY